MILDMLYEIPRPLYIILIAIYALAIVASRFILIRRYETARPGRALSYAGYIAVALSLIGIAAVGDMRLVTILGIGVGLILVATGHWLRLLGDFSV